MSKLGIFDSGLGGYSIASAIHKQYPKQDIVYLADQKNVPYGNKSNEELISIVLNNLNWFKEQGVTSVLIGCNTSSVLNLKVEGMQITGIIDLTASQIKEEKEIIVIATSATIRSHAYAKAIRERRETVVHEVAMPNLASLIENLATKEEVLKELDDCLKLFKNSHIPAILACTHYPLVKGYIEEYLQSYTYDSLTPVLESELFTVGEGTFVCYTTADPAFFDKKVQALMNEKVESIFVEI